MAFGDIVLLRDRTAHGPYTRAQIQEGLSRGEMSARDLAHTPGLKDWLPLLEVLHHLDREPVQAPRPREPGLLPPLPVPARAETNTAAKPANPADFPPSQLGAQPQNPTRPPSSNIAPPNLRAEASAPSLPPPTLDPPSSPSGANAAAIDSPPPLPQGVTTLPERKPAPLGPRCVAWAIDWAVLFVPVLVVFAFAYVGWLIKGPLEHRDPETARQEQALLWRNLRELLLMVAIGFAWVYAAVLESSRWQGTVGKQCVGLIVTDAAGQRLSFLHATGRHAAKYLSALPLFLGFMAALFNPQRLTWHDRLAGTRVVKR